MRSLRASSFLVFFLLLVFTYYLVYALARSQTMELMACYGILFGLYLWVYKRETNITFWLVAAVLIRLSLLTTWPSLSDDLYRFVWDGRLWAAGIHPFLSLPSDLLSQDIPGVDAALYEKLNSKDHFTCYPPLAEFVFWLSVKISPDAVKGSVMVMRALILLAEIGTIGLIVRLLERFKQPAKNVLLYALNPLVILELTGNLHFEAFVIFFLLLGVWLLTSDRVGPAGISFSLAIAAKLLPMIFLPVMLAVLGWRKALVFYLVTGVSLLILFIPMYDEQVFHGFSQSLSLYFQKFEFNASLYYLVREYGFWRVGYNTIQSVGWKLGVVSALLILAYSLFWGIRRHRQDADGTTASILPFKLDREIFSAFIFILFIYLLFTTTVHPWYITPLIAFSVITRFRFVLFWSALIFLTYAGYSPDGFGENLSIMVVEYAAIAFYLGIELLVIVDWNRQE
jgi:alpha-1,6-mannosyltransferase